MSATTAINKYVALRQYLVTLHGTIGNSKATGAPLPKLTHADKWILSGIFMASATEAIKEHTIDGYAYTVDKVSGEQIIKLDEWAGSAVASDVATNTYQAPSSAGGEAYKTFRRRPLAHWVAGTPTTTGSAVRTFNGYHWYAWIKSSHMSEFFAAVSAWDDVWTLVRQPPMTSGIYLTLDETESLFAALYRFAVKIPASYLHFEISAVDQVWEDTKKAGSAAIQGGAEAAGDAAAWAANQAGEAVGGFLDNALSGVGMWGIALVAALLLLGKAGVL